MFVVMVFYCVLLFLGGNFQKSLLKIMIQNYFNPVPSFFSTVGIVWGAHTNQEPAWIFVQIFELLPYFSAP